MDHHDETDSRRQRLSVRMPTTVASQLVFESPRMIADSDESPRDTSVLRQIYNFILVFF